MEKKGLHKYAFIGIWSAVFVVLLAIMIAATCITSYYDSVITDYLGSVGGSVSSSGDASNYFKADYDSVEALQAAEDALCKQMGEEAVVLLENDNVLPLSKGAKVSVFGMAGASGSSIGSGSGASASAGASLLSSLKSAGLDVNEPLMDHYANNSVAHGTGTSAGGGSEKGDWSLGKEADFNANFIGAYTDAAIFVITRNGGEGGDLARTMDNHGGSFDDSYLTLSPSEKETLQGIKNSGKFSKIILLVNTANAMELGGLEEYGVNAVLWYGGLGANGLAAVGEILVGDVNPSGRLVDTYVYDNFSAPAIQNFGDYRFTFNGTLSDYSYVNYAEGIYVGYKYYETRYEDKVMGTPNAGDYDYVSTVLYPFGYGLSYTTFEWSNYSCAVENGTVTVSVDVKNTGSQAGKDVVQIYYQSEYTNFDKNNDIEKSAVNLVEFGKTGLIEPTKSETVTISFPVTDMKCYDAKTNKTYILEDGDYYITAAHNAHEAVNNILAKKEYKVDGIADFAEKYNQAKTQICKEGATVDVTNQFDNAVMSDATYLSRRNWSVLDGEVKSEVSNVLGAGAITSATAQVAGKSNVMGQSGTIGTMAATAVQQTALKAEGYEGSGNPKEQNSYTPNKTYGQDSGLELVDMRGKDYDDADWDKLLNQIKFSQIYELFGHAGYGTIAIDTINKPKTMEYDGPTGFNSFVNGTSGYSFPNEISMAATWNKELLEQEGILIGNDAVFMSAGADRMSGWYAPAVNIHRTAFSGRNYEYYSEDATLSGKMSANVIKGVQSKGVYVYLKHYALNDQETNRSAYNHVATFATEQTIREIYLKAFEIGVKEGGALGIMTSMNRVGCTWAAGNYALNTEVLRNEWGFKGIIITDYVVASAAEADQILASGGDLILTTGWDKTKGSLSDYNSDWARAELRRAAHNTLYVQANSIAMNGFVHGTAYQQV